MVYDKDKIRKKLTRVRASKIPDEVEAGDKVIVFLEKYHINGEVRFSIKQFLEPEEDPEIPEKDKKKYQVLVQGELKSNGKNNFNVEDIQKVKESKVCKCKEEVKEKVLQVFRLCFPSKQVQNGEVVYLKGENQISKTGNIRPLTKEDIKVTTVWKDITAMHVGWAPTTKDYLYKVGVNWEFWHSKSNTGLIKTLSHEVVHFTHPHHKKSFYIEHAKAVSSICSDESKKEYIENSVIGGEVNWNKLKTLTMKGPHRQPSDIDDIGYENKREACNDVVSEMEEILGYDYEVGMAFHVSPPYSEYSRMRGEWPSRELPEGVSRVEVRNLEFERTHSDEEIYEKMKNNLKEDKEVGFVWEYGVEDIPVVDSNMKVTENQWFAEMVDRMINQSDSLLENEVREDVEVPVVTN